MQRSYLLAIRTPLYLTGPAVHYNSYHQSLTFDSCYRCCKRRWKNWRFNMRRWATSTLGLNPMTTWWSSTGWGGSGGWPPPPIWCKLNSYYFYSPPLTWLMPLMCASLLQPNIQIKQEPVDPGDTDAGGVTPNLEPSEGTALADPSSPLDATSAPAGPGEEESGPPPPPSAWDKVSDFLCYLSLVGVLH